MPSAVVNGARAADADDDIVMTGLSGRLPESDSIEEFAHNLFEGIDMVTADDRRWPRGRYLLAFLQFKLISVSAVSFLSFPFCVCSLDIWSDDDMKMDFK